MAFVLALLAALLVARGGRKQNLVGDRQPAAVVQIVDRKPATVSRRLFVLSHVSNIARKEWGMESLSNPVELERMPQPHNSRTRRMAIVLRSQGRGR